MTIVLATMTAALLLAAAYAQWNVGLMLVRGLLIVIGVAFGLVASLYATRHEFSPALVFLSGFGLVHLPTALILILKLERGELPS